jgi:Mg-chelatase subunit ChlD
MGPSPVDSLGALVEQFGRLGGVEFARPERIWLAAPVALVLLLAPLMSRRSRPRLVAVGLRALLLAALTAVLLEPSLAVERREEGRLVVVADVSPSVGEPGIEKARGLLRDVAVPFDLVACGAEPRPAPDGTLQLDERPATDIGAALRVAAAHAPPDLPLRVVLISDGRPTRPGSQEAARRLRDDRIELWALGVPDTAPDETAQVAVAALELPPPAERREPFTLRAKVKATRATTAKATLFLDGKPYRSRDVELPEGDGEVVIEKIELQPGRYHAQLLLGEDTTPGDNISSRMIVVPGTPKVVLLAASKRKSLIAEALAKQGMEAEVVPVADADLKEADAVVILPDAPAEALARRSADLAELLGRGGGLLAVGGAEGAGLGRLHATPPAHLLPVEVEPREDKSDKPTPPSPSEKPRIEIVEEEAPAYPVSICLLVDRSGSMRGRKMRQAKAAAEAAAMSLTKHDRVAVVVFGNGAEVFMRARQAGDADAVRRSLAPLRAEGRTAMFAALQTGFGVLNKERTPIRHLILISDGVPTDSGRWRDLVSGMAKQKITLSTVGIGFDIDSHLLGRLATWGGGMYWMASHPSRVPQVVTQDTMRIVEARNRRGEDANRSKPDKPDKPDKPEPPKPPDPAKDPKARPAETVPIRPDEGAPREMFLGLKDEALPEVAGVEESELRFAAWTAARAGEGGPPLVAYARMGLGTSAALMVDPESHGGKALREHEEFTRLAGQLLRSILPDVRGEPFVLETRQDAERLSLHLRGEDGLARTDLPLRVTVDGVPVDVRRRAGRYEVALPPRAKAARVDVQFGAADTTEGPVLERSFVVPASRNVELAEAGIDKPMLLRLAGEAERVDADPATTLDRPVRHVPMNVPLPLPFLAIAAILLPLDAWARRRASR